MTDVNALEAKLKTQQWVGGQQPTAADKEAYEALKNGTVSAETHPHTFAWFCLVFKFSDAVKNSWPAAGGAGGKKEGGKAKGGKGGKKEEKPKKEEDDDFDLFGDDNEEDAEAAKKAAAAAKEKAQGKKKKKEVIAMSLVLLEVKPLDDTTNLDDLAQKIIKEIVQDGLYWKTEYKKEPVAFGIFKLIIGFSLEDEKVSVDGVVEKIEEMEDFVQSVEIAAFNKI